MKIHPSIPVLAAIALAWCGLTFAQAQQQSPTERLAALEKQVQALQKQVADLQLQLGGGAKGMDVKEMTKLVEGLVAYVEAQAKGAGQLVDALAVSKEKGFTAGINPDSRTVMLDGMNKFLGGMQRGVPKLPKPAGEQPSGQRR